MLQGLMQTHTDTAGTALPARCQIGASFSGRSIEPFSKYRDNDPIQQGVRSRRYTQRQRFKFSLQVSAEASRMKDVAPKVENVSPEMSAEPNISPNSRIIELSVRGLKGQECVAEVVNALKQIPGVLDVKAASVLGNGLLLVVAEPEAVIRDMMESVRNLNRGFRAVPYQEKRWSWRGHHVNYSIAGRREGKVPLVAVHGFGGNCHHWRKTTADLLEECQVYAPDLMGFGASAKPSELTYDAHLWSKQVIGFIEEVVQEPSVLIGNSIGSQVAMYVASERPDLVKGICLLNCVGGMNQRGLYKDSMQLMLMRPMFELFEFLLKKKKVAAYLFSKFSNRERVEKLLRMKGTPYANPDAVHSELVDIFVEPSLDSGAVDVFVGVFTGDPGPRPEKMMEKIACPVLVAWGEADPWTPHNGSIGTFFQKKAAALDNVVFVTLPETGHSPQDDRPELVAAALIPWLRREMQTSDPDSIQAKIQQKLATT